MTHAVDIDCIPTTSASTLEQEISTKRLLDKIPAEFVPFISPQYFTVMGHKLTVPNVLAGRRVALMSFEELCGNPLGSVDYIGKKLNTHLKIYFLYYITIGSIFLVAIMFTNFYYS